MFLFNVFFLLLYVRFFLTKFFFNNVLIMYVWKDMQYKEIHVNNEDIEYI